MVGSGLVIGDVFRHAARAVPDRVAAIFGDERLTFRALDERANATAHALAAAGLVAGDRVLTWGATNLELVVLFAAAAKAGLVFAPMSPHLGTDEAEPIARAARPAVIVADADRMADGRALGARLGVPVTELDALTRGVSQVDVEIGVDERAPHVIFFTSGSSGRPKGAVLSHRVNFLRTHPGAQFESRGVAVCMFPLFHMGGWTIALQQWQARDAVVLLPAPEPVSIFAAVTRHRATRLNCIPLVWRRILDEIASGRVGTDALATLEFADTGTSATPPELLVALRSAMPNATVRVFYGSTEAGNVTTLEPPDFARKPGRVGVPSVSTEIRVGAMGELEVSGPLLADGYFEDDEATAAAFVDGWYRTGDLAEVDGDGFVSIVGRANAVIRTGGESVVPAEVEQVLGHHPMVADIVVVGVPDPDYGEIVCAVVVPGGGLVPTLDELRSFAVDQLAGFKLPRRIEVVDAIPRTAATSQPQRALIVEQLLAREP